MKSDRILNGLTKILLAGGLLCVGVLIYRAAETRGWLIDIGSSNCYQERSATVSSDPLMQEAFKGSVRIRILENYYDCNKVKVGDLVYYEYSKGLEPIVRMVDAISGDHFNVIEINKGEWNVEINSKKLRRNGEYYTFNFTGIPPLKSYHDFERDQLADNEYLLFTYSSPGNQDSSQYGIVMHGNLRGRIVPVR